jgi:putative zinc finger protein
MNRHLSSEQLSAHLDGEVAFPESREIQSHLAACEDCRDRFEALQHTVGGIWRLERAAPPVGLATRVRAEVAAASRPQTPVRSFVTYIFGLSSRPVLRTAAAMGLALVLSLFLVTNGVGPKRDFDALDAPARNAVEVVTVEPLGDPPLFLPQTTSQVAGREFVWTETQDIWVQRGLEGEVPEARISAQSPQGRELLKKFSELGLLLADGSRVVLRYRLETVELSKGV